MIAYLALLEEIIEFAGNMIIVVAAIMAMIALARHKPIHIAKRYISRGAITCLDFRLAATLLKALTLFTWQGIAMFVALYAIRTIAKQAFRMNDGRRWLGDVDSNHDKQSQSLLSYR